MFIQGTEECEATEVSWTGQTLAFCCLLVGLGLPGTCTGLLCSNAVSLESAIIYCILFCDYIYTVIYQRCFVLKCFLPI